MNEGRKEVLQIVFILAGVVFLIRLFFIQVLDDRYEEMANSNSVVREIEYPSRGLMYDRNHKLIAFNNPEYDLLVITNEIEHFDSARFCKVFDLKREELRVLFKELKSRKEYSRVKPTLFLKQLSNRDFASIQDHIDEFSGFHIQPRTARAYSSDAMANVLGYVSEITKNQLERDDSKIYRQGDYIGQSGLESYYESFLRGTRGASFKYHNVQGIEKGSYFDGKYDTASIPGRDLTTTVDLDLQQYAEKLLAGKVGSIIAIEPSSGEILTMVSGPSYDPSLLTGKKFSSNFAAISSDTTKPLFARPLMAQYPPGSIFKIVQSLIGLQEGVLSYNTIFACNKDLIGCHNHPSPLNLHGAIENSCNPYFFQAFRKIINQNQSPNTFTDSRLGLDEWHGYVQKFGLGSNLGIDLPNEKGGQMPGSNLYNKIYGENRWKFSTIASLSIGQGEMLVTPLQMANLAALIANKGYYITPHLGKEIEEIGIDTAFTKKHNVGIDTTFFSFVTDAMTDAITGAGGTAHRAAIPGITLCGKTGTAQNAGEDNSVFIVFAPRENPKIAMSVYVEHAGFGGRAAASIASLIIEKYLTGEVKRKALEDYVLIGDFLDHPSTVVATKIPVSADTLILP